MRPLVGFAVSVLASGCCTEMGCSAALVIHLDRALAADAGVAVAIDGQEVPCVASDEPSGASGCEFGPYEGGEAILVAIGAEPPATAGVTVTEGAGPSATYEVAVIPGETWYPNGKRCGSGCTAAEADLAL